MAAQELQRSAGFSAAKIPDIRKITLALDGSESSVRACEAASFIASGFKATVTAVSVLPRLSTFGKEPVPDQSARVSLEKAMVCLLPTKESQPRAKYSRLPRYQFR